jgi:hypothetical protein
LTQTAKGNTFKKKNARLFLFYEIAGDQVKGDKTELIAGLNPLNCGFLGLKGRGVSELQPKKGHLFFNL